jgi:hypothetical protein
MGGLTQGQPIAEQRIELAGGHDRASPLPARSLSTSSLERQLVDPLSYGGKGDCLIESVAFLR